MQWLAGRIAQALAETQTRPHCLQIERQCRSELAKFDKGLANVFIQHTSASLTINEVR